MGKVGILLLETQVERVRAALFPSKAIEIADKFQELVAQTLQ
jgi:hypothetical protein